MAQTQELRQLKDYDVLGVGACRRENLLNDLGAKVLLTHSYLIPASQLPLYASILQETLQWLNPQEVREGFAFPEASQSPTEFLFQLLLEDFQKNFPKTSLYLNSELRESMKSYLLEFPWKGPLLSDHFRYFPLFLKRKFQDSRLYLMAQKEWLCSYLSFADFGGSTLQTGRIFVNPSLQVLHSGVEIQEVQLKPGLSIFYYDFFQRKVREYQVSAEEAAVMDLLQEERVYNLDQLVEQLLIMELPVSFSREEWRKKLVKLKSESILIDSGLGRISN